MTIDGLLLLPEDVRIDPVLNLDPAIRARFEALDGDFAVTRRRSRIPTSIVDADSTELLENFRQPTHIADAVIAFARRRGRDPRATLDAAYPMLDRLYRMGVLVPAVGESAGATDGVLKTGDVFAGFRLVRCIHAMHDSRVFLGRDIGGQYAAVKFYPHADLRRTRALVREARLLRRIGPARAPQVLGLACAGSGLAVATEWIFGVDALEAAAMRHGVHLPRDEHGLLCLCVEIASVFAHLHEKGVLHGDVHPRNVLIEASGSARLIDFGCACDVRRLHPTDTRIGVPFYFEPEFAQASRRGRAVAPSLAGEQYSVAALLYELWTGVHHQDWRLERDEMLRQIIEGDPVSFEARRVPAWPALEQVLHRALDKHPERRFPSARHLADALHELLPVARERDLARAAHGKTSNPETDLLERVLGHHSLGGRAVRDGLNEPPVASINYGAAGIAYGLLRIAQLRGDPLLLAAADVWSCRATALAALDGAFYSPELQLERATVGDISLFHSPSGLHCVRALVCAAQCDVASTRAALKGFVEHATRPCGCNQPSAQIDLVLGKAGLLLGCAELIESVADVPDVDLTGVRCTGEQIAGDVLAWVKCEPVGTSGLATLGIAHGWAGLLFSLLRWACATQCDPDPAVRQRLQELAALAEPSGMGLKWPIDTKEASFAEGWCNGSAGHAMLFALACRVLGQPDWGRLAERAALSAWSSRCELGSLCCGQGGIGYAMLALHRLTGDRLWLQRGHSAARRAAADRSKHFPESALYKGALGVALLAEDLKRPERSAMPLFEPVAL